MAASFDRLMRLLAKQHMNAVHELQKLFKESDSSYSEALNDFIAFLVAYVRTLRESNKRRAEFLSDPFWPKVRDPSEEKLTRLVAMFMVGASDSNHRRYDSALDYTKLAIIYLDRGVDPVKVAACIVAEGGAHRIIRSLRPSNDQPIVLEKEVGPRAKDSNRGGETQGINIDDDGSEPANDMSDAFGADDNSEADVVDNRSPASPAKASKTPAQQERADDARYWADFLKRAKAIEVSGRRPLLVAVDEENFREATGVDRQRPAILQLHREQVERWVHIVGVPYRRTEA